MIQPTLPVLLAITTTLLVACSAEHAAQKSENDLTQLRPQARIFTAAKIITMDPKQAEATAVAVKGGLVLAVGDIDSVSATLADHKLNVDTRFEDKVLMPGFVENHLHPALAGLLMPSSFITPWAWDLPSQQVSGVQGRADYLARLSELEAAQATQDSLLITWGYHQYFHGDLSRADINQISMTRPIIVWQRSFHEVIANDAALALLGITEKDAAGHPAIDFAEGHFWETGLFEVFFPKLAPVVLAPDRYRAGVFEGLEHARRNGITTVADQGVPLMDLDMEMAHLNAVLEEKQLPLQMLLVGNGASLGAALGNEAALLFMDSLPARNTARLTYLPKQVKLLADGAFYSQLMQMQEGYLDGHHGEWIMPPQELRAAASMYWREGYQLHVHVNGDEGLRVLLDIIEALQLEYPRPDHQTVIHHYGYSAADQSERVAALGIAVSANPYYLWALADKYAEVGMGPERASHITRLGALERLDVPISFHSDLPMAPAAPLTLAAIAASRQTALGNVMAPREKMTVEGALRGITIDAARAIQQQDSIGSIEAGKRADFTVLEQDPYAVKPYELRNITVWGTVFAGEVYPR